MLRTSIVAGLVHVLVLVTPALTADNLAGIELVSAYVFRGVTYNDGPCIQSYLETSTRNLTFNLWTNFDLKDYGPVNSGDFSEVDFSLSYGFSSGQMECTLGVLQFLFPESGSDSNTREIFMAASLPAAGGFELSAYAGYDFDFIDDFYASLGLGYGFPLKSLNVILSYKAGYAGENTAPGGTAGFHDHEMRLDVSRPVSEEGDLGAFFVFTDSLNDDVLPKQDVNSLMGFRFSGSF